MRWPPSPHRAGTISMATTGESVQKQEKLDLQYGTKGAILKIKAQRMLGPGAARGKGIAEEVVGLGTMARGQVPGPQARQQGCLHWTCLRLLAREVWHQRRSVSARSCRIVKRGHAAVGGANIMGSCEIHMEKPAR